jgi:hypothetical protein
MYRFRAYFLGGKEPRVVDPLRQPERRREAGLDAPGGEPTLALIPAFLSDVGYGLIHPRAGLLPVLRGAHLARDGLLQHTHGGMPRFLTRGDTAGADMSKVADTTTGLKQLISPSLHRRLQQTGSQGG